MIKKILALLLILAFTISCCIQGNSTYSYANEGVELKKGDKILIGNDYWRVLDPNHANNGEDGIFITLDTYNENVWWICNKHNTPRTYPMSVSRRLLYQKRHMKSCPFCKGLRIKMLH